MLKLAINGIDLGRGRGGNESYLVGLIGGLAQEPRVKCTHVLVGEHFKPEPGTSTDYVQTGRYRRVPYLLWQQSLALRRVHYDWFLSTFFLPAIAPCRSALLVHDLSFLSLPRTYPISIRLYMRWLVSWAIRRARKIIVLSEFVRSELLTYYPNVPPGCVIVLNPGISGDFRADPEVDDKEILSGYDLAAGYILSVSSIHPRKNLTTLLQAYQLLREGMGAGLPPLVVAGQRYWGESASAEQARRAGVHLLGYVPQRALPALYRDAGLFVYPSIYEGFGLPPLEAMACGVPTVCGDSTSLPEAVGDAAVSVNVRQPEAIAGAVEQLYLDAELRATLVERGLARARTFTWQGVASRLVGLLQS